MSTPISVSTTGRASQAVAHLGHSPRRASSAVAQAQRERAQIARVESMVNGMETLARRISSNRLNGMQRTVSLTRLNDLQRRVNRMDGIVVGEGRGESARGNVSRALVARQGEPVGGTEQRRVPERTDNDAERVDAARRSAQSSWTQARRGVEVELQRPETPRRESVSQATVQRAYEGIRDQAMVVVGERPDSQRVDLIA